MSGLASNLFRKTNAHAYTAPGFIRLFFSKLGSVILNNNGPDDYNIIPVATMVNNSASSLNSSTSWNKQAIRDSASGEETNNGLFTKANDGITVTEDGYYDCFCSLYQEASSARTNVGVLIHQDGAMPADIVAGAGGYIRNSTGHSESSTSIHNTLKLNAGDKVTVSFRRFAGAGTVTSPAGSSILIVKKIG